MKILLFHRTQSVRPVHRRIQSKQSSHFSILNMRPPRNPTLIFPNYQFHISIQSLYRSHQHIRLSSTAPAPSLIKTHNIPAPHLGHIRVLSLNNPRTRNAISRQLLSELSHEINAVKKEADDEVAKRATGGAIGEGTRVLILASEVDECFCSGADLKERAGMSLQEYHYPLSPPPRPLNHRKKTPHS